MLQMATTSILPLVIFATVLADPNIRSSGFVENKNESWRREFKRFTDLIEKSMRTFEKKVNANMKKIESSKSSVVYTRWGKKTCPFQAELVFSGYAGGGWYMNNGAAVNPLCLPRDPEWGSYRNGRDHFRAGVHGGEYETNTAAGNLPSVHMHDVPCAVCVRHNKSVVKMFPARRNCYTGWKLEYHGYLMAGLPTYEAGSMYTCVDGHPDTVHGGHANGNGYLFYMVEGRCGSLKCPPYVDGRELVCAVCSKE